LNLLRLKLDRLGLGHMALKGGLETVLAVVESKLCKLSSEVMALVPDGQKLNQGVVAFVLLK